MVSIASNRGGSNNVGASNGHNNIVGRNAVVDQRSGNCFSIVSSIRSQDIAVNKGRVSLSLTLDNMLDRSVLGNVLRAKGTDGFSSVLCWVVVVGDLMCGSSGKRTKKRRGIGSDRGSNTVICGDGVGNSLNNRDGKWR